MEEHDVPQEQANFQPQFELCRKVSDSKYEMLETKLDTLFSKIDDINKERTVIVTNGITKEITHSVCLTDLWNHSHIVADRIMVLEGRTEILDDIKNIIDAIKSLKKYIKPILWLFSTSSLIWAISKGYLIVLLKWVSLWKY